VGLDSRYDGRVILFAPAEPPPKRSPTPRIVALAALAAIALGLAAWLTIGRPPERSTPTPTAKASPAARSRPAPPPSPPREAAEPRPAPSAASRAAVLRVEADVPDASVFIDHRFVGKAPVDVRDVKPGPHRLNVSAEGHEMYAEEIEVGEEPRTVSVRFTEVRLDESMAVVHKHGLGSCRGLLRADPGGLAFEAEGGRDSFRGPLGDLERFEVDYLKRSLRVSWRGGRSYNFTVDGRSADPLLVFQQKVDKARKRLRPL